MHWGSPLVLSSTKKEWQRRHSVGNLTVQLGGIYRTDEEVLILEKIYKKKGKKN